MNSQSVIAFIEAIASYFSISLGFVLQKKGVGWIGYVGKKERGYYLSLIVWLAGYLLLNLAVIPNYFALRVLNSYLVNAISGLNIVFMVFLSGMILKEKLYAPDFVFTVILCASIVVINIVDRSGAAPTAILPPYAYLAAAIPIVLFFLWLVLHSTRTIQKESGLQAVLLGAVGGSMSGLMVTFLKLLQLDRGTRIPDYLTSPYFYLFLAVSILSMVAVQIAYKMGDMILVGPAQFASMVFYPVLAAYFIFLLPVNPIQIICFAVIIISVIFMVYFHNARAIEVCK